MHPGGLVHPAYGVVMHIMGGSTVAADNWFHNPSSQVSAHFGISVDGHLIQWVDTDDRAWHAGAANPNYYGVETEGSSGPLTEAQCQTFARLWNWLQAQDRFPTAVVDRPGQQGFIWHGAGGTAWGGHPYCPGDSRKAQRQHILDLANHAVSNPSPGGDPLAALTEDEQHELLKFVREVKPELDLLFDAVVDIQARIGNVIEPDVEQIKADATLIAPKIPPNT